MDTKLLEEIKAYIKANLTIRVNIQEAGPLYGSGTKKVEVTVLLDGDEVSKDYDTILVDT